MKNLKKTLIVLSVSLTLVGCGKSASYSYNLGADKKGTSVTVLNKKGEKVYLLDSQTPSTEFKDKAVKRMQEQIQETRRQRSDKMLAKLNAPEEKLSFSKISLTNKKNGLLELGIRITKNDDRFEDVTFNSLPASDENISFNLLKGSLPKPIFVRGYCLDLNEEFSECSDLVLEVSYVIKRTKVVEQFQLKTQGLTPATIKKDFPELKVEVSKELEEEALPVAEETEQAEPDATEGDDLVKEETAEVAIKEKTKKTPMVPIEGPEGSSSVERKESLQDKKEEIVSSLEEKEAEVEKSTEEKVVETEKEDVEAVAEEKEDLPDESVIDEENAELATGESVFVLPDVDTTEVLGEVEKVHFRNIGEEAKDYEDLDEKEEPVVVVEPDQTINEKLFSDILSKNFNQARGSYHKSSGKIVKATQLKLDLKGADAALSRRTKQYASGISTKTLEYTASVFNELYPDSPICINDLSAKRGGKLSGHSSHRNGLDIDISKPSSANDCSGRRFVRWANLKKKDERFFEKNWEFLKILTSTNRVHVVFTDSKFIKKLCTYTKSLNLNTKEKKIRKKIFKKLHHVKGHANHYHIRMTCNSQNKGCQKQGILKGNVCK